MSRQESVKPSPFRKRRRSAHRRNNWLCISQLGLFILASAYTVYLIRPVLLPIILALLVTLILKPVHKLLTKYLRIPSALAAFAVVAAFTSIAVVGIISLSQPVLKYKDELRGEQVKMRLKSVFQPISDIQGEIAEVAQEVEKITKPEQEESDKPEAEVENDPKKESENQDEEPESNSSDTAELENRDEPRKEKVDIKVDSKATETLSIKSSKEEVEVDSDSPPVKVEIRKDPIQSIYLFVQDFSVQFLITLALAFFILAFGDKMIRRIAEYDGAANLIDDLTSDVSFYLFTITIINCVLGLAIFAAMWGLGMPNPVLWGVMAALLNFIPFIGALMGTGVVFLVAAINFDSNTQIVLIPIIYYAITAFEGNFVTPTIIGRRFTINPMIVFVWVLSWGAMWGIAGMMIALPLLMVFRIVCAKLPGLTRVDRIISV